jgi:uncharacterized protein (TIGR02246 family)
MSTVRTIGVVGLLALMAGTTGDALSAEDEVKKVALDINQAFVRNDLEGIAKYVADDITWFSHTSTKRQDGKKVFIDSLRQSIASKKSLRWQERDIVVQVFGDAALVTFLYDHDAEINGKRSSRLSRATYGFAKRSGKWWLVHDHSSAPLAQATSQG